MALLLFEGTMKTVTEDHPMSWETPAPAQARQDEPASPQEEPASAAGDDPEHQTIEEPGYGHGV